MSISRHHPQLNLAIGVRKKIVVEERVGVVAARVGGSVPIGGRLQWL